MKAPAYASIRDFVEPAHPMVVKLHDDLVTIYTLIRQKYQQEIDAAFDRVSRQIGFVVTTTLPVVFEFGEEGGLVGFKMSGDHLQGTLFERELTAVLKPLMDDPVPIREVTAGTYKLHMIWYEALKLKLRTDWVEPAHFRIRAMPHLVRRADIEAIERDIPEPAHWFDPGAAIALEEVAVVSAIDEVYPELRLMERISYARSLASLSPQPEPPDVEEKAAMLEEIAAVLSRYGY